MLDLKESIGNTVLFTFLRLQLFTHTEADSAARVWVISNIALIIQANTSRGEFCNL